MNGLARVSEEREGRKVNPGSNVSSGSKMDSASINGSKMIPGFHRGSDTRDLLWYHFDSENRSIIQHGNTPVIKAVFTCMTKRKIPITKELRSNIDSWVIYLVRCTICKKQYVGKSDDSLKKHWRGHLDACKHANNSNSSNSNKEMHVVGDHFKFHFPAAEFDYTVFRNTFKVTLIDCIEPDSNLVQGSWNLDLLQNNWIDKLESLDSKTGLNWRDKKASKTLPGQRKLFKLKSWTEEGAQRKNSNFQKSSIPTFQPGPTRKSFNSSLSSSTKSLSNSSLNYSKRSTIDIGTRKKSPTNEVKICIKELESTGTLKPTTDNKVLIETIKYLHGEITKLQIEKVLPSENQKVLQNSVRKVIAAKTDSKPLKLPKLDKSTK